MKYVVRLRDNESKTIEAHSYDVDGSGYLHFANEDGTTYATIAAHNWTWVETQQHEA